ncbi:unnamed protein product [Penicillium egyptiacum]|uniref:ASST-domain-containing protein n=1 Tax=Penicillium egyptiacum TaxID=1303716 RepID=A0A9W4KDT3_9EURO|nr:unnamed protein product [Penicillium egyptiacum]
MAFLKQTILAALATTPSLHQSTNGYYRSRPDLAPPQLNITIPAANPNGSEYVFIAPFPFPMGGTLERPGPYIYRKDGDLVWAGTGYYGDGAGDFHPTTYQGKPVLQAFQGIVDAAHGVGFGQHVLLDQCYQHVVTSTAGNHRISSLHEFNVIRGETALIEVFYTTPANLSAYGGNSSQQWLGNGNFQESTVPLGSTNINSGLSRAEAWDYFHINSLDKNEEGDYLLSSRNTNTIFKISSTDGSIIWRLGGKYPTFSQIGNWTFGDQHDARWQPQLSQPGTEVISFLDNFGDGTTTFNDVSRALVVQINHTDSTATVLRKATAPYNLQALLQGNAQMLSDDRIFVNWGSEGAFTEFGADNEILYHAFIQTGSVSYRGFLSNWTAAPKECPALVALKTASDLVELYVSWNGDTETSTWRFFYVNGQRKTRIGHVDRVSFESSFTWKSPFTLPSSARFVAEAVGANGECLAQTSLTAITANIELPV